MSLRLLKAALLAAILAWAPVLAPGARADGDPGSDVLVYQSLFVGSDSGLGTGQQLALTNLLNATRRTRAPIRVAIIAHPDDLGVLTPLWREPQSYARYLGIELSLAYSGQLLVVMPDGFGFTWPGHPSAAAARALSAIPVGAGAGRLFAATETAVRRLAAAAGVRLPASLGQAGAGAPATATPAVPTLPATVAGGSSTLDSILALVLILVGVAALGVAFVRRRSARAPVVVLSVGPLAVLAGIVVLGVTHGSTTGGSLATNPDLDPGGLLHSQPARNFTLTDQFGHQVSLRSFRGKVVILAFTDAECQTICPLTTTAMVDAKRLLGPAGSEVQLLGVDANPKSTSIEDVLSYSQLHGMTDQWHFLTGTVPALERVWNDYGVAHDITNGLVSHTPALFVIDRQGRLQRLYITQPAYAAVPQLGQLLAQEASSLLPGHPRVLSHYSYAQVPGISPGQRVSLPRAGGGTVQMGPGAAHLYLFFATWDQESTTIAGHLGLLNQYEAMARKSGLPRVTAVDEGSVEPSSAALPAFLRQLPRPLSYPVAIDQTGQVADGYEVQGQPWFVLTSPDGQIAWYQEVYTSGWPTLSGLVTQIRAALSKTPKGPAGRQAATSELAGSPAPLAALHAQGGQLLGSQAALDARVRALRGYPIVINIWASSCAPCQEEFGLLANASARYGKQVAFLGADYDDQAGDARSFLAQHYVSYPSYQTSDATIQSLLPAGVEGTPTTLFLNRAGKIVYPHVGQYVAQGTLDQDIQSYALGG